MTALESTKNLAAPEEKISLETLSKLTGFSVEIIESELFDGKNPHNLSLDEIRSVMLNYIDSSFLEKS